MRWTLGGQVGQDALAAVGAVAEDDDLVVGEPPGHQGDEFQGQFRSGAMIRDRALGLGDFFRPFLRPSGPSSPW